MRTAGGSTPRPAVPDAALRSSEEILPVGSGSVLLVRPVAIGGEDRRSRCRARLRIARLNV
ncbi:MAG: hypothetical protein AVDCRST_MAG59-1425 [uncultured Thermomicrobiales bacterium]|jgi:hypothetical protein|uniref:Uncharacterized protein n=1 Tax=uncultured Thermomicrobiales bacterium TaxID=1645740 RepID=A0A6J4UFD0_9BACT|nr:MAG: hypothetical protein AVDCRST_MAG59-1425 [uncultured Thermomicrobiales bacterium]